MTNEDIYKIMQMLGMMDMPDNIDAEAASKYAEYFSNETCADPIRVINFVDDLLLYNDIHVLKDFFIALFLKNKNYEDAKEAETY